MQHLLPTENELSEQYHVSHVTVRKAFAALEYIKQWGTLQSRYMCMQEP